jgi:hypothetical protein
MADVELVVRVKSPLLGKLEVAKKLTDLPAKAQVTAGR